MEEFNRLYGHLSLSSITNVKEKEAVEVKEIDLLKKA